MAPSTESGLWSMLRNWLPVLRWGASYGRTTFRADLIAGATTAAVVIPQAMAYATIAGLPVQTGLYCALVPMAVYAMLGTSRPLSVSTTSTISLLTAQALSDAGAGGDAQRALTLAATLAVMTGILLFVAGVVRLGFLADFIGPQVLTGFKIGVGLSILVDQLSRVLGITVTGDNFFQKLTSAVRHLPDTQPTTAVLAGASVAALLALARFLPRLPGPLLVLGAGIIAVGMLDLADHGVALISPVPAGLPAPTWPDFGDGLSLLPAAAGVALMAFVESIAAARAFRRTEDDAIDADQELRALGAANGIGALFGAYPAGGGLSQTAVNDQSGARSQGAALATVIGVALTLTLIAPIFDNLAEATLGAIVLVAALGLVDRDSLQELRRINGMQWLTALVPLVGVLLFGTVDGVLLGVLASLFALLHALNHAPLIAIDRSGRPVPKSRATTEAVHGLLILRVESVLYYANIREQLDRLMAQIVSLDPPPEVVVLDLIGQGDAGQAVADGLQELRQRLQRHGSVLWVSGVDPQVLTTLERTAAWQSSPIPHFSQSTDAVAAYESSRPD